MLKSISAHNERISSLDFHPNGEFFASGANDQKVKVWSVKTKKALYTVTFEKNISEVKYTANGSHLIATSWDGHHYIIDPNDGRIIKDSDPKEWNVGANSIAIAPNNQNFIVGRSKLAMIAVPSFEVIPRFNTSSATHNRLLLDPEGKSFWTALYKSKLRKRSIQGGKLIKEITLPAPVSSFMAQTKDGRYLAYSDKDYNIIVVSSNGLLIRKLVGHKKRLYHLAFSPDGKWLATSAQDKKTIVWNLETGQIHKSLPGFSYGNTALKFSPDGSYLVATGYARPEFKATEKAMMVWETNNYSVVHSHMYEKTDLLVDVEFTTDGKQIITCNVKKEIKFWDIRTGYVRKTWTGHDNRIVSLEMSSDGKFLASGSDDNTINIWNNSTGRVIHNLKGHTAPIRRMIFSPGGKYLISTSEDNTTRYWDLKKGQLLATFREVNDSNDYVVITPDGRFDGTDRGLEMLYYVEGLDVLPLSNLYEKYYTPNLLERTIEGEQFDTPTIALSELKLPPKVKIVSPYHQSTIDQSNVKVTIKATDQGGGIDEIRLYHNGKLVNTTQRGFKSTGETKDFSISLVAGENRLRAIAFNDQRTESLPDEISVFFKGTKKSTNLHMLVVGINKYRNSTYNLNYATKDATAFKSTIESGASSIFDKVNVTYIYDENATKLNILSAFNDIKNNAGAEDMFVFYYAGHGVMNDGSGGYQKDFYLVPFDVTKLYGADEMLASKAISSSEIQELSKNIAAQKQLFILDACQSGGALNLVAARGAAEEKAIAQLARSTGTYWMTASGSEQFATEFQQLGHGVFTYAVLEGLSGKADGSNHDRKITAKELGAFIEDKVPELTEQYKGEAQFPRSYGFGQDFPIVISE